MNKRPFFMIFYLVGKVENDNPYVRQSHSSEGGSVYGSMTVHCVEVPSMYGKFSWTTEQVTLQDPFSMPSNQHLRRVWHQWSPTLAKRLRTFYKLMKKMLMLAKHENNDKNLMMNMV